MRKLLRNKLVVGYLVAVATLALAWNFLAPHFGRPPAVLAPAAEPVRPAAADAFVVPHVLAVTDAIAQWNQTPGSRVSRADPFAYPASARPAAPPEPPPAPTPLVLQAISVDDTRAFAVVNRAIVAAGDALGEYRIESIEPTKVWVRGPQGRRALRLNREAPRPGKPTAQSTPPPASAGALEPPRLTIQTNP